MAVNNYVGNIWIEQKQTQWINDIKLPEENGSSYMAYHMGLIVNKRRLVMWGYNVDQAVYSSSVITYTTTPTYNTIPHWPLYDLTNTAQIGITGLALQAVIDECVIEKLIIGYDFTVILVNYGVNYAKKVYVRGLNDQGQGGNGLLTDISRFRFLGLPFFTLDNISDVICGAPWIGTNSSRTTLLLDTSGRLWETGRRPSQAGASTTTAPLAVPILPNNALVVKALSTAGTIIALGDDSFVYAIGLNGTTYQFGNGITTNSTTAWVNVKTNATTNLGGIIDIFQCNTLANTTWYALSATGVLYAWGLNTSGQCADGTVVQPIYAGTVKRSAGTSLSGIVSFACAGGNVATASQCCCVISTGECYVWGSGNYGNGVGGTTNNSFATLITQVAYDADVGSGVDNTNVETLKNLYGVSVVSRAWRKVYTQGTAQGFFAITRAEYGNELYHLGYNFMGQAGTGGTNLHTYFQRVPFIEGVSEVWCHGYMNTTAVQYNIVAFVKGISGRMYCAGGGSGLDFGNVPYGTAQERTYIFKEFTV